MFINDYNNICKIILLLHKDIRTINTIYIKFYNCNKTKTYKFIYIKYNSHFVIIIKL